MAAKLTNKEFSEKNEPFKKACEAVGLEPTARQASKWRMRKGKAWKLGIRESMIRSGLISPKKDG